MRKSLIVCVSVLSMLISSAPASADEKLVRLATSLCDFAKADDRTSMRRKLKASGMKLRAVYPVIQCGADGSLLRVAGNADALNAAKFIVSKVGKKNLQAPEPDGKSIHEWAKELVASQSAKQPFLDIIEAKM